MCPEDVRERSAGDLSHARLDQIIDPKHRLAKLARLIDWQKMEAVFGASSKNSPGRPSLPTRLMLGLSILKQVYSLSDEALYERWIENPYFQYFCGEDFFRHNLTFDRSSLSRWRQWMEEQKIELPFDIEG